MLNEIEKNNPAENQKLNEDQKSDDPYFHFDIKQTVLSIFIAIVFAIVIKSFFIEAYKIPTGSMKNTLLEGDFLLVNKFIYGVNSPVKVPFLNVDLPKIKLPAIEDPSRGDIIVFEFPGNQNEISSNRNTNYVKRCVALPGDTLEIRNKKLFINGKELKFPNVKENQNSQSGNFAAPGIFPKGKKWNENKYGPIVIPKAGDKIQLDLENIESWRTLINRELNDNSIKLIGSSIYINDIETNSYTIKKDYYFVLGDNRNDSFDSRFWGFVARDKIIGKAFLIYWSWNPHQSGFSNKFNSIRWNRIIKLIE